MNTTNPITTIKIIIMLNAVLLLTLLMVLFFSTTDVGHLSSINTKNSTMPTAMVTASPAMNSGTNQLADLPYIDPANPSAANPNIIQIVERQPVVRTQSSR